MGDKAPSVSRSLTLHFVGDWGQAPFHRILAWLTQEFCDRAGPRSRTAIWSIRGGGIEALDLLHAGEAQLALVTPPKLISSAISGLGILAGRDNMSELRTLAVLPKNDRMVLAIDPSLACKTFSDLRQKKPVLRIAMSSDDGTNVIGYTASRFLGAHGISIETIRSWGGDVITSTRPEQCLVPAQDPNSGINAVIQEAIMTPWWRTLIDGPRGFIPLPAEPDALEALYTKVLPGLPPATISAGFWNSLLTDLPALDFSDYMVLVRNDMPEDIAYLLTWCLVERRSNLEKLYQHIPPDKSPLTYPLRPEKMARPPLELHQGAKRFYQEYGYLNG